MELTPEEQMATQFERLSTMAPGTMVTRLPTEWLIATPSGYVLGATLADAITRAEHRGLL